MSNHDQGKFRLTSVDKAGAPTMKQYTLWRECYTDYNARTKDNDTVYAIVIGAELDSENWYIRAEYHHSPTTGIKHFG